MRGFAILLTLALGSTAPLAGHPLSDCTIRIATDDGLTFTFGFTLDDVFLAEGPAPGTDGRLTPEALATALAAYQQRVVAGLRLYDHQGRSHAPRLTGSGSDLPESPIAVDALLAYRCHLVLAWNLDNPASTINAVSFDFGQWSQGVSTTVRARYNGFGGIDAVAIWEEAHLYPLLPDDRKTVFRDGEPHLLPQPLESRSRAFSYGYLGDSDLRHELLVPLSTAVEQLPASERPSLVATLDLSQRQRLVNALTRLLAGSGVVRHGNRRLAAERSSVHWFTRDGLRRGLPVASDVPLPVATGFVGIVETYRRPAADAVFDHRLLGRRFDDLLVTILAGDQVLVRQPARNLALWAVPPATATSTAAVAAPALPAQNASWPWWLAATALALSALALPAWTCRAVAVAALALGIAATARSLRPQPLAAAPVVATALDRIYRAAGESDERRALAGIMAVCNQSLATKVYLEARADLSGPWRSRAGLAIDSVDLDRLEPLDDHGQRARWTVVCRLRHWGHVHHRTVAFTARLVHDHDGRLAAIDLVDKRLVSADSRPVTGGG